MLWSGQLVKVELPEVLLSKMLLPLLHWSCTVSTFQVSQNSTRDRHCCMNIVISSFKAWVRTHCCMFFCAEAFLFLPLLIYFCGPFTKRLFFCKKVSCRCDVSTCAAERRCIFSHERPRPPWLSLQRARFQGS